MRFALIAASVVALCATAAKADDPITLKFGFPNPPTAWIYAIGEANWAKDIATRTGGKLTVQGFAGGSVVNQRNVYDRVLNGVVDFGYGPFGEISDQMPRSEVTSLPFESPDMVYSSAALWSMYKSGILDEDFKRLHIITTFCLPPSGLHLNKAVAKLEDIKGEKIATAIRANGEVIDRLGATIVAVTNPEAYGAVQRGMAQGIVLSNAGVTTFKLHEVTKYHLLLPLGCTTGGFFMNKESYAKLAQDLRAALDAASGDDLAKYMAEESKRQEERAYKQIEATPGAVMLSLDAQELERWHARLRPIAEEWAKTHPDGEKVLAAFRSEIARRTRP
jgi:TRAP-type C4-dicarboxylate transport system substrate-binding protein